MKNALKQIDLAQGDSLDQAQRQNLAQAIQGLSRQQLNWASGYLAGLSHAQNLAYSQDHDQGQAQIPEKAARELQQITILYASQTGNAESIAHQLQREYQASGFNTRLISSADFRGRDLAKERYLLLVISTQGEGEAPESAFELQQFLFAASAPQLKQLNYAVFGLGDSSYPDYCQAAKDFDRRLEELGAHRLLERIDADVDFDERANTWRATVIQQAHDWLSVSTDNVVSLNTASHSLRHDRNNPYLANVLESKRITTQHAIAEIHHIELQIDANSLQYKPGDSIGLWSRNNPALVNQILQNLALDADTIVDYKKQQLTIQQALEEQLEITQLHPSVIKAWAALSADSKLQQLIQHNEQLRSFAKSHQLIDLVIQYPATVDAPALLQILLPLQPRLYSIASSQQAFDDEIHLTVSTLQYSGNDGDTRYGSASQYLNQHIQAGDTLRIYVAENTQFRLPKDSATPIIMIGAGTGIAPFRAFLQQRKADNASGENWLIFGNRNFHHDFLYQLEWQKYRSEGLLNRISLAFSRDHKGQVYVQDRLFDEAEELYRWIDKGAQLYVCGSSELGAAVHQALLDIVQHHNQWDTRQAEQFVNNLRAAGRYLRDVY